MSKSSPTSSTPPTARQRPGPGAERRGHRAAVLPLRHALRGERDDNAPGNQRRPPAPQHARHLRQRPADRVERGRARRASARRAARPGAETKPNPPLYDYSDDFYLEPTPDTDKGVQIRRDDTTGCHYVPTGTTEPESQVHRWVTDPMASDFKMTEKVTLEFYTRTLNDELYTRHALRLPLQTPRRPARRPRPTRCLTDKGDGARPTGPTSRQGNGSGGGANGRRCG